MQDYDRESIKVPKLLSSRQRKDFIARTAAERTNRDVDKEDRPSGLGGSGSVVYLNLLDEMREMHLAKSAGYGTHDDPWSNFRLSENWGVPASIGCLIRMADKYQRLQNLIANPENDQVGETAIDTAMDMAAYALIYVCLLKEKASTDGLRTEYEVGAERPQEGVEGAKPADARKQVRFRDREGHIISFEEALAWGYHQREQQPPCGH